jgi:hypothetical protein
MEVNPQSKITVVSDMDAGTIDPESIITGVKKSSSTNEKTIDTSIEHTNESEENDVERKDEKIMKLLEVTGN